MRPKNRIFSLLQTLLMNTTPATANIDHLAVGQRTVDHKALPREASRQIEFLRMFLVIGITFIHYGSLIGHDLGPWSGYVGQENGLAVFVSSFILYLALCGVPTLSAISGFLFFRGTSPSGPSFIKRRLKRRAQSLFVPLLIWNGLILAIAMILFSLVPDEKLVLLLEFDPRDAAWFDYINKWIGITKHPIVYPMWFVRDLCLTAFLSPLLWVLARKAWLVGVLILGGSWLLDHDLWIFFRTDIPFFFFLGMLVAIKDLPTTLPKTMASRLFAVYLVLVAIRVLLPSVLGAEWDFHLDVGTRLLRLLGVVAIWTATPLILHTAFARAVSRWSPFAFFVHCGHFPMISAIKYAVLPVFLPQDNSLYLLLHLFLGVGLTLALLFVGGSVLHYLAPKLLYILSGSRRISLKVPKTEITGQMKHQARGAN